MRQVTPLGPRLRSGIYGALLFLVLGVAAGVLHNRAVSAGRSDPTETVVRTIVARPAGLLSRVTAWLGDQTGWILRGRSLDAENRTLRARVLELEGENATLRGADIRYRQLRDDMGFVRSLNRGHIAADVIGRRPDARFDTLLLDAGSSAGVRADDVVVSRSGLVGRITDVTPGTSTVLLITDQNSGVGARIVRPESRAAGVCKGTGDGGLVVRYLNGDADVRPGDAVASSGLGDVFPAGLPIGVVTRVEPDEASIGRRAAVRPAVAFDLLEQVYVLRTAKARTP